MADAKLTDLNALSVPSESDALYIVSSRDDTSNQITYQNLIGDDIQYLTSRVNTLTASNFNASNRLDAAESNIQSLTDSSNSVNILLEPNATIIVGPNTFSNTSIYLVNSIPQTINPGDTVVITLSTADNISNHPTNNGVIPHAYVQDEDTIHVRMFNFSNFGLTANDINIIAKVFYTRNSLLE